LKSLIVMNYTQPVSGGSFRWGVLQSVRDTNKNPVSKRSTWYYRWKDKHTGEFQRSQNLATVQTRQGVKAFYLERAKWKVKIPFVGSLVSPFI